jgi:hypothetical protein
MPGLAQLCCALLFFILLNSVEAKGMLLYLVSLCYAAMLCAAQDN